MNIYTHARFAMLLTVGTTLLTYTHLSMADGHPVMQWGSMELTTSVNNCLGRTKKAFYDAAVQHSQTTGRQMYGEKGDASVLVSCSPLANGHSYLLVAATSNDSGSAERLRNDIRARIARMIEFD